MRSIWLTAGALALCAACSGDGDDPGLTGRWHGLTGEDDIELFAGGRFAEYEAERTLEGDYTAEGGILTLAYDESPRNGAFVRPIRVEMPFWTDGDTLLVQFASPDHAGDDVAGTWRMRMTLGFAREDGSLQTQVFEVVTELAPGGTAVEEVFIGGTSQGAETGTYTVMGGEIRIAWDAAGGSLVQSRALQGRRLGGITYVRAE